MMVKANAMATVYSRMSMFQSCACKMLVEEQSQGFAWDQYQDARSSIAWILDFVCCPSAMRSIEAHSAGRLAKLKSGTGIIRSSSSVNTPSTRKLKESPGQASAP